VVTGRPCRLTYRVRSVVSRYGGRRAERLLAEFDGAFASLSLYLAGQFVDACADLPHATAGPLHERFLGWLRV